MLRQVPASVRAPGAGWPLSAKNSLLAVAFIFLFAALVAPRPRLAPPRGDFRRYCDGRSFEALAPPPDLAFFRVAVDGIALVEPVQTRGAVFGDNPILREFFHGTFIGGDVFTGTLRSAPFPVLGPVLYLPLTGYPARTGNFLTLCVLDDAGRVTRHLPYTGINPRESIGAWEVDTGALAGASLCVEMSDGLAGPGGWLGVGRPIFSARAGLGGQQPQDFRLDWLNYAYFGFIAVVLLALLLLPGAALARLGWMRGEAGFLPLPGFILLTGYGFLLWLSHSASNFYLGRLWLGVHAGLVLVLWLRPDSRRAKAATLAPISGTGWLPWLFYSGACLLAMLYSAQPLSVALESYPGTNTRGRTVASAPDNIIPYATGVFFFHGHSGRENTDPYFGADWSLASRGPLVGWLITTGLNVCGIAPHDPPRSAAAAWPADEDGYFVARLLGILTNALIVLAAAGLVDRLAHESANRFSVNLLALSWLALSPVVALNTIYLWPKLLAGYFVVLSIDAVLAGRRAWLPGILLALAYLSHPIAALFAPGLALFRAGLALDSIGAPERAGWTVRVRRWLGAGATLAVATFLCLLPWLIYKWHLGAPDSFSRYPLGDGQGLARATSVASWLRARWQNLWFTLVPGAFHFSDMDSDWLGSPVRGALHWNLQYAKTLPGHLGHAGFLLVTALALRSPSVTTRAATLFGRHLLGTTFLLMLLVWGFNSDGLGRACLEPLSVLVIISTAVRASDLLSKSRPAARRWLWLMLAAVAAETAWVLFTGVWLDAGFSWVRLDNFRWLLFVALGVTLLTLLGLARQQLWPREKKARPGAGVAFNGSRGQ